MSADPRRAEIDRRVLEWMCESRWSYNEKRFEELALELFAFQFEHCEIYRRFCEGRSQTPENVKTWMQIPAVPTSAFKEVELRCFPAEYTAHCFHTSGTSTDVRGTLYLDTLKLYEASLLPTFRRFMFPELLLPDQTAWRCEYSLLHRSNSPTHRFPTCSAWYSMRWVSRVAISTSKMASCSSIAC